MYASFVLLIIAIVNITNLLRLDQINTKKKPFTGTYGYETQQTEIPDCFSIQFVPVTSELRICLLHYKTSSSKYFKLQLVLLISRRVLIQSHGNAVDIGYLIHNVLMLGQQLDTDIIIYDYEGYGCSDGITHCKDLTRDLAAVYDYATQFYKGKDIFLMGESSTLLIVQHDV